MTARAALAAHVPIGLLLPGLAIAVPLEIRAVRTWGPQRRQAYATANASVIGSRGDALIFRSAPGATAERFAELARLLACLAYAPGGITFFGLHFEAPSEAQKAERLAGLHAEAAWGWVLRHDALLLRLAARYPEVDGAHQIARLAAYEAVLAWRYGEGPMGAWAYTRAKWRLRDAARRLRSRGWRPGMVVSLEEHGLLAVVPAPDDGPSATEGVPSWWRTALERLPERDRRALQLRYWEDASIAEIGRDLGVSESSAGKQVARALRHLRELLEHRSPPPPRPLQSPRAPGLAVERVAAALAQLGEATTEQLGERAQCTPNRARRALRVLEAEGRARDLGTGRVPGAHRETRLWALLPDTPPPAAADVGREES